MQPYLHVPFQFLFTAFITRLPARRQQIYISCLQIRMLMRIMLLIFTNTDAHSFYFIAILLYHLCG